MPLTPKKFVQLSFGITVGIIYLLLFSLALQPSVSYGLIVLRGFLITHDAPQLVRLLWTSDSLVAETSS
jgi:xanthosine utilization system XapX-like protein